ncbi:putative RING finger protein C4G3.12c [Psilocybe cubensis]|uniref:RING finger protein C4G3.12c n=2 Tax=Psilocybe cubensis TaxID=181762 RepID=A0ACB8H7J9_PSICU|nr:putative RING finger protein C4G3.12c [Psilocybe cubensis]KAH9483763.1 putative RING finger protein C4G3.12c [Psilocybe cubensis]
MGQSSSKYHESSSDPTPAPNNAVAGASTDPQPSSLNGVDAHTSDSPGSRRSSVRKSILKLVKPSSIRNRFSSDPSSSTDAKRSWRRSRRWSRAPLAGATPDPPDVLSATASASSASSTTESSNLPPFPTDKGKQRDISSTVENDDISLEPNVASGTEPSQSSVPPLPSQAHPAHTSVLEESPVVLVNSENVFNDSSSIVDADLPSTIDNSERNQVPPIAAQSLPSSHSTPSLENHQTTPEPRQFPPPGTLVVVQGIVHTTDVSRAGSSLTPVASPQPEHPATTTTTTSRPPSTSDLAATETRARNRLSTLLRRSASRPPSSAGPTTALEAEFSPAPSSNSHLSPDDVAPTRSTSPVPGESIDGAAQEEPSRLTTPPPPQTSTTETRVPAISSSSIDVLGTLLSVAAAATAASLLTGSSEPILSSGLATPNPPPPLSSEPLFTSPSSASLPTYHRPNTPIPNNVLPDISAAGRAERMRQAWGTIRERLGLRPSASPMPGGALRNHPDGNGSPFSTRPNGDSTAFGPADTREIMLAEMARAFNIGLGLNGLGGLAPSNATHNDQGTREALDEPTLSSDESDPTTASPETHPNASQSTPEPGVTGVTLPPEGSFERFLVDLQIDLRAALSQTEEDNTSSTPEQQNSQQVRQTNVAYTSATADQPPDVDAVSPAPRTSPPEVLNIRNPNTNEQLPGALRTADDSDDMPSLQTVSESESESDGADAAVEPQSVDVETRTDEHVQPPSGTSRIDAFGRINWWRLYRFPPIPSRADATGMRPPFSPAPTNNPMSSAASSEATLTPDRFAASSGQGQESIPLNPQSNPMPSPIPTAEMNGEVPRQAQTPVHAVVPVIVVGLQSVNQDWRPDLPTQPEDGIDIFGQPPSDDLHTHNVLPHERADDDDLDGWGGQQQEFAGLENGRGRGRARGWHSRAANAIRNLRPGRRTAEANAGMPTPLIAPGSRTFLIYVIGGYYPPDHSIVTGGPNILDSFEALLELADLLGQVKPPTVSKDDIEKSGLEIIKASELVQHEKDGKVSSNCLDRCLICLDDYEPEDPIRVMSCRHAFHKNCVDEWLQKGRNNCPACRSTGVATDAGSTMPMPAS